jgi:HAD superfamily hydrolase (TIGR01509 family)
MVHYALSIKHYKEKHGFERFEPKAVLFDMDGVLYDSMPNHAVAWQKSMAEFGIQMSAADAYATEGQRGVDTIRQMVRRQQGREISEQEAQAMYDEKSRLFHLMPEAPMMPGAYDLMAQIRDMGMSICIVTGSGQRQLIERLKHDYGKYLDEQHIVTAYDVTRGKPHPEPYLKGLEKSGSLNPWEAVVVENAPLGVEAAVAARIFTVCVNTGRLPVALFEERRADLILDSMMQLNDQWQHLPFRS